MPITLSDEARRHIAAFEEVTGATAVDCLLEDDRAIFVVATGEMGQAIGPGGDRVETLESELGRDVTLVEDAETPAAFVANALAPAAVRSVTVEGEDTPVARVEVDDADMGLAIGPDGQTIETARTLVDRHFGIEDVELV